MFKTKSFLMSALVLLATHSVAQAQTAPKDDADTIISVLVKTDATRQITEASPAIRLTTQAQNLLRANLEQSLSEAADSTPDYLPNSQFIADMKTVITENNGQKSLHFELASTRPAPSGNTEWVRGATGYNLVRSQGYSRELVLQPALPPRERSN